MNDPYYNRFPGPGRVPQANPSDGGAGGIGADSLGTQFRDWTVPPILARITGHGTDNAYSWQQVALTDDVGTYDDTPSSLSGTDTAFEANGLTTVVTDTIVELLPNYGTPGYWTFVAPGSSASPPTTCKTVVTDVQCVEGNLVITYDTVRVIDEECP